MTIIFQKNERNGFLGCMGSLAMQGNVQPDLVEQAWAGSVTFFPGTQPSAATLVANWVSTYAPSILFHQQGVDLYQPNAKTANTGIVIINVNSPVATAIDTGTAAWAIVWGFNLPLLSVQVNGPGIYNKYLIVPVSDLSGSMPIRLTSTSITSGNSYSLSDVSITAAGGSA